MCCYTSYLNKQIHESALPNFMEVNEPTPRRKINIIEYSQSTRKANLMTKKGKQAQTAALNINLKTINKNQLLKMPILTHQQKKIIADYLVEKANFFTTRKLFGAQGSKYSPLSHQNIQRYLHNFYQNTRFVQNILQNENMDFPNKLILLKFFEKIRQSAIDPKKHTNWKHKY